MSTIKPTVRLSVKAIIVREGRLLRRPAQQVGRLPRRSRRCLGHWVLCNRARPRVRGRARALRKLGSPNELARLCYWRRTALLDLAHVPRALRHPCAVSLVSRLGGNDADVVRAGGVGPEEWRVASGEWRVKSEMKKPRQYRGFPFDSPLVTRHLLGPLDRPLSPFRRLAQTQLRALRFV